MTEIFNFLNFGEKTQKKRIIELKRRRRRRKIKRVIEVSKIKSFGNLKRNGGENKLYSNLQNYSNF